MKLQVIANKVETEEDLAFVREQVKDGLLTWFGRSDYVRAMEKGDVLPFTSLEAGAHSALTAMKRAVDNCQQDWDKFYHQAVEFHRRNALAWMNTYLGEDVTTQIDPDFSLSTLLTSLSL
ncbi:hypothetical protein [Ktedonobacter racemifer]|uniref:hypothetical protein n=1 Tax=Ktedonobacter racemifer TaxID=363277 RepID=UPI00069676D7|nr:hypothetical protein [Ktedonobacter racemifer]